MSRRLLLVVVLAAPLFAWRLGRPGFSDTEGMYAEPAREMVLTGDWVTPRMNGAPFLTKPPLAYWLAAGVMAFAGPTEFARIGSTVAALGTVLITGALGTELFGDGAGLAAAAVLATTAGFLLEARLLRTDMLLIFSVTSALWCYVRLRRGGRSAAAVGLWAAIALGLLDKGLLAVVLPGAAIGLTEAIGGELRPRTVGARMRALRVPLGVAVVAAVALPWHLAATLRNPGFLWDYVVNQHLLAFFDAKLPRDSIPDSLAFFWAMFFVRTLPWGLLLPAALIHGWRARDHRAERRLVFAWIASVLVVFSLASGRLEHYSLPALPAVALLVGDLVAEVAAGRARMSQLWLVAPPAAVAGLALVLSAREPAALIRALDPALAGYGLDRLVGPTTLTLAAGLGAFALLVAVRRARSAVVVGAATAAVLFGFAEIARERVEPLFSWRPFARAIEDAPDGTPIFFRASDEYQLCGGLDYYTGRYVALLAPPGWSPPTFLVGRTERLFVPWTEFERAWRGGKAVLVSDDVPGPAEEAAIVPGPYELLARAGDRVLVRPAQGW